MRAEFIWHHSSLGKPFRDGAGFTLVEITVVFALFVLLAAVGLPFGIDSYRNYILSSETRTLVSLLRRSESLAIANRGGNRFGIAVEPMEFVLFKGTTFASRDPAADERYLRSPAITVAGLTELTFAPLSGRPNITPTVVLSNAVNIRTIGVNAEGALLW